MALLVTDDPRKTRKFPLTLRLNSSEARLLIRALTRYREIDLIPFNDPDAEAAKLLALSLVNEKDIG